jgi:hypothetical protein
MELGPSKLKGILNNARITGNRDAGSEFINLLFTILPSFSRIF